jgi:hypothetical protein
VIDINSYRYAIFFIFIEVSLLEPQVRKTHTHASSRSDNYIDSYRLDLLLGLIGNGDRLWCTQENFLIAPTFHESCVIWHMKISLVTVTGRQACLHTVLNNLPVYKMIYMTCHCQMPMVRHQGDPTITDQKETP